MKKITTFLLSTVFLSKTLASKALRRVVRIILFLIIFSSFSSYAIADIQEKQDIPKMVQRADLIIRGKVISTESQWKEDSRGRHIYTSVTVKILDKIKGNIKDDAFAFEIVGGTVDDIREVVSDTPAFEIDEDAIVFLSGQPLTIKLGTNGKILIYDGKVYWDGLEIAVDSFIQAIKILEQDPNASVSLEEKYQAPTAGVTAVPNITNIYPDKASAGTNTQVTITGTNFGSTQGSSKVWFFYCDGQPKIQASIVSWSNTQIVCKVPVGDVGGYTASASSGPVTVTTSGGTSNGYDFKVTFGYSGYKWPGTSPVVSYYINQNTSDCTGEDAAVQSAASSWNNVGANFTFQYGGSHTSTVSSRNNVNEIMWGTTGDPYALAETHTWVLNNVTILECDVVFNDPEDDWSTKKEPYSLEVDVEEVALHEFGHWLSLEDLYGDLEDNCNEYDTDKVMYGYHDECWVLKRNLHPDDIAGICYIYGGCPVRCYECCEPEDAYLGTIGTVVWGYSVSGNCGNCGKWVGQFVGEAGKTYHFDLCPDSPGSGTASFNADIKITNSSCGIITGQDGSCSSPQYLPNDFQWTCSTNGTYYVIIAPYNSYNSHTCGGTASDTFTLKYYKCSPPAAPATLTVPATDADGVYTVNWAASSVATSYQLESSAPAAGTTIYPLWVQVYSGTAITYNENVGGGNWSYRVKATNACGSSGWTTVNSCVVSDCLKNPGGSDPNYIDWKTWRYPACWCYQYQCRSDINGKKTGGFRVQALDLAALAAAYNKTDTVLATVVVNNVPGICADINHKRTGGFRVQSLDLQELAKYFNKADAQVPSCTAGYYNYWKTPP